ncbi:hypothetical protein JCM19037_447 [Geomicrobium sp. JCM 19037]|uniref:hypothetical protein n=1 Tax=unclassified Geomicrobium TaxID=2628951 RepID=UPI00045F2A2D|nr:hypothetical protein [Geomicrobium sp. JCM 19037]GAK02227.1 hypothetical protein JCM19037_447 [Geomicrobium sp. JCM 19037]
MSKNNKEQKHDHQFRETKNHGEHRNGRLSQFKNHTSGDGEEHNEYLSKEDGE